TTAVDVEIEALWRYAVIPLTTVAGTNTVTATSDTTVVAAIAAYAKGMKFSVIPANDNTGAVTINIDSVGAVSVKDSDGNALAAGSWKANRQYIIEHDGTNFRKWETSLFSGTNSAAPDVIARDEKTTNTAGGTFTSGSFATRTLNTLVRNNNSIASLSSSQITLPAGTYYCEWSAPGYFCGHHQTRLQNITDATTIETGQSFNNNMSTASAFQQFSAGSAVFVLSASKAIALQHICQTTRATDGLGGATNLAAKEVYAWINIWK